MSRYVMVRLIPCQSPHVRPIVVMPGGTRYTLARYGQEFEAGTLGEEARHVLAAAWREELPQGVSHAGNDVAWQTETEFRYTLNVDTGEVRRWRVLVTVEASEAGKMTVHR